MTLPFGLTELTPDDLKTFRLRFEGSISPQPIHNLGEWFISTYTDEELDHGFTEPFTRLQGMILEVPDYTAYVMVKHLLSKVDNCSPMAHCLTELLLQQSSPLLLQYGLCMVISGHTVLDRETSNMISQNKPRGGKETLLFFQIAEIAIKMGVVRIV
jgi:hypothetical protein